MKVLSVVFFALMGISAALVQPPRKDCFTDVECKKNFGNHCFCLQGKYETIGMCICNMDPKIMNLPYPCMYDEDCIGNVDTHNGQRLCGCHRDKPIYLQPQGECKCLDPLY